MFSATDLEIEETTRQKIGILADNVIELFFFFKLKFLIFLSFKFLNYNNNVDHCTGGEGHWGAEQTERMKHVEPTK